MSKFWQISSPITVHVEVTEACNERCRHCYNFFRIDNHSPKSISWSNLNDTIDELVKNKVMHVIITGGEPLLALNKSIYLATKCLESGMSISLNSNLVAATADNMRKLKASGIDHILTTLHSWKEDVHDYVANTPGAFKRILNGIKLAQENDIRITVNTILFQYNKDDIFKTGEFIHSLGVEKYLANRSIPSPSNKESMKNEFYVGIPEAEKMFDDLLRLKAELGMKVGTCRTVPQCLFSDLKRFDMFLARGCAAGKKHLSLNVNGDSHACVHESDSYGNIHEIGLKKVWENMSVWRTYEYIPDECQKCQLFEICDGGCRLVAKKYKGSMKGHDNLRKGSENMPSYDGGVEEKHIDIAQNRMLMVHPKFDYRKENGFYIVRTEGARVDFIEKELCETLIDYYKKNKPFTIFDIGKENIDRLAYLIKRELVIISC